MLSKNKIKFIRSLELKKNRQQERLFVAEGPKVVGDLLAIMPAKLLVATSQWQAPEHLAATTELINVSEDELQ